MLTQTTAPTEQNTTIQFADQDLQPQLDEDSPPSGLRQVAGLSTDVSSTFFLNINHLLGPPSPTNYLGEGEALFALRQLCLRAELPLPSYIRLGRTIRPFWYTDKRWSLEERNSVAADLADTAERFGLTQRESTVDNEGCAIDDTLFIRSDVAIDGAQFAAAVRRSTKIIAVDLLPVRDPPSFEMRELLLALSTTIDDDTREVWLVNFRRFKEIWYLSRNYDGKRLGFNEILDLALQGYFTEKEWSDRCDAREPAGAF